MPFTSKRQQRAAFGGHIPGISAAKAKEWAAETDFSTLPDRAPAEKGKPTLRSKEAAPQGNLMDFFRRQALEEDWAAALKAAPDVSRRLVSHAREHLPGVRFDPNAHILRNAFYSPSQDIVSASLAKPHQLAHELGHAELQRTALGKFLQDRPVAHLSNLVAEGTAPLAGIAGTYSGYHENDESQLPAGALLTGAAIAAHAPVLGIEAGASLKGLRMLKQVGASPAELGRGKLLGAFGTYALPPALSAVGGVTSFALGQRLGRNLKKEREKKANYKLQGEQKFRGLDVAIENAKGSTRKWKDAFGKETGQTKMKADYGYIRGTQGADKDHVDVYLGPDEQASSVYIVNQMRKPDFKVFDEHKCLIGFSSLDEARKLYLSQYNDPRFLGSIRSMPFDAFKVWVFDQKKTKKQASQQAFAEQPFSDGGGADVKVLGELAHRVPFLEKSSSFLATPTSSALLSLGRKTASSKSAIDGGVADSHFLGDGLDRQPSVPECQPLLQTPSPRATVLSSMLKHSQDLQVAKVVVQPITISMVNDLGGEKTSAQGPFHDDSVLQSLVPSVVHQTIRDSVELADMTSSTGSRHEAKYAHLSSKSKDLGMKIAFAVTPGMLSGLQHAGVGAGIGALAGGLGGAMHAQPGNRGRGAIRGALAGAGLGAAGGAGIAAIKGHGAQQLATLRSSAQEAEQAALQAHGRARELEHAGWSSPATMAPVAVSPAEAGTLAAAPGRRARPAGAPAPAAAAPAGPSTEAVRAHVQKPQAYGYHPTESPAGTDVYVRKGQGYRQGPVEHVEGFVPPSIPQPAPAGNYALAQQQAAAAGSRAAGLDTAARTLQQQQGVMNQAINRAGLVGAAAGTGLMGYMAVPSQYGGVGRQPQQPGKIAELSEEERSVLETGAGLGALAGGGVALSKSKPLATGRTTLYHGTTPELAQKIRQQGLLPSAQVHGPAVTDILAPDIKEQAKKLVYLTPHAGEARGYAGQAEALAKLGPDINYAAPHVQQARALGQLKGQLNPLQGGLVEAELPMWQKHVADVLRANPEARGNFDAFRQHTEKAIKDQGGMLPHKMLPDGHWAQKHLENNFNNQLRAVHDSLSRAIAVEGGVAPEFIRGSDKFKSLGLQELKQYAATHPGRFAAGAGLAGLGVGAGLMGAKALHSGVSRMRAAGREKSSGVDINELAAQVQQMKAEKERDARSDRIVHGLDALGLGILAAPAMGELTADFGKSLEHRGGRIGVLGGALHHGGEAVHHALGEGTGKALGEAVGLGLMVPHFVHPIAHRLTAPKPAPQEPPSAAPPTPAQLSAEKVGRLLAHTAPDGQEKVAISVGGVARGAAGALWRNRKPIAGLAGVATVGAGLYGGKKMIDAATDMATEAHEPARYVGVPQGMRSPSSV